MLDVCKVPNPTLLSTQKCLLFYPSRNNLYTQFPLSHALLRYVLSEFGQWMIENSLRLHYKTVFWVWDLKKSKPVWDYFLHLFFQDFYLFKEKKFQFLPNTVSKRFSFFQSLHCHSTMRASIFFLNSSTFLENYELLISQQEVRMVRFREHPTGLGRQIQWSFYL